MVGGLRPPAVPGPPQTQRRLRNTADDGADAARERRVERPSRKTRDVRAASGAVSCGAGRRRRIDGPASAESGRQWPSEIAATHTHTRTRRDATTNRAKTAAAAAAAAAIAAAAKDGRHAPTISGRRTARHSGRPVCFVKANSCAPLSTFFERRRRSSAGPRSQALPF